MGTGLALGTAQWGLDYGVANRHGKPSMDVLEAILRAASGAGVRVLDTARAYGDSEARIGRLLDGDNRFVVVTKLAPEVGNASDPVQAAYASVEESLVRLRRKRLDVLLLHRPEHRHVVDGRVWEALLALRARGVIGELGISALSTDHAEDALRDPDVGVVQVAASVLDRRLEERGFHRAAAVAGKKVLVRGVFLQGAAGLSPDSLPVGLEPISAALTRLREIAADSGLSIHELCLRYIATLGAAVPVVGCERPEQLERNATAWSNGALPEDLVGRLRGAIGSLPDRVLDPWRWVEQSA